MNNKSKNIDEKLKMIDELETSDSSLDKYLELVEENDYIDAPKSLSKNIYKYVTENIKYKEMSDIVNNKENKKERKLFNVFKVITKIGKTVLATSMCLAFIILLGYNKPNTSMLRNNDNNDNVKKERMIKEEINYSNDIDENFSKFSNFMLSPISEIKINNINNNNNESINK